MNKFTGKDVVDLLTDWNNTSLSELAKVGLKSLLCFGLVFATGYYFSIPSKENWINMFWHFLLGIDFVCAAFCMSAIPFKMRADLRA